MKYLNDKEFFLWAFGKEEVEVTLESLNMALEKLYECYIDLKYSMAQQKFILERMNNHIFSNEKKWDM